MKNFRIIISSPYDREKLVSEIWYNNDFLAEMNQEQNFLEIVFYYGGPNQMKFSFDELQEVLQEAKTHLIGDSYNKILKSKASFIQTIKMNYVNDCKILISSPSGRKEVIASILHKEELLAEISKSNDSIDITLYYHNKNIEAPIDSFLEILNKAKIELGGMGNTSILNQVP